MSAERDSSTGQHPPPVRPDDDPEVTTSSNNIFYRNPLHNSQVEQYIWGCDGLTYSERVIITGVLQNIPRPIFHSPQPHNPANPCTTQIVSRIVRLSITKLKVLARFFYAALTEARELGTTCLETGGSGQDGSTVTSAESPLERYRTLFADLGIAMSPTITNHPAPVQGADRMRSTLARQLNSCPITQEAETNLELTQILPISLRSLHSDAETPLWMFLGICLSPAARDELFTLIDTDEAKQSTINSVIMRSDFSLMYNTGLFHFAPLVHSFNASTCRHYDVCFYWWGPDWQIDSFLVPTPENPEDQVAIASIDPDTNQLVLDHVRDGPPRTIESGDEFRLFTNDPANYPLPHPLMFRLHGMIWRMMASTGIADWRTTNDRRYSDFTGGNMDDEGSGDRAAGNGRRDNIGGGCNGQESGGSSGFSTEDQPSSYNGNSFNAAGTQEEVASPTLRTQSKTTAIGREWARQISMGDITFGAQHLAYRDVQLSRIADRHEEAQELEKERTDKEMKRQERIVRVERDGDEQHMGYQARVEEWLMNDEEGLQENVEEVEENGHPAYRM